MARETLTVQEISRSGLNMSFTAAVADGHKFENTGREFIRVKNASGSSVNVTIQTPGTVDGLAVADRVVAVPAAGERDIGSFTPSDYNQDDGDVYVDYSATSSVSAAAVQL